MRLYQVLYGVKGARKVNTKLFDTKEEAQAFAKRWRASNSTGDYFAKVS